MKDELALIGARAEDLYRACQKQGIAAGDFMAPAEAAHLMSFAGIRFPRESVCFFGGYADAERCVPIFMAEKHRLYSEKQKREPTDRIDWDSIDWEKDDWWEQTSLPDGDEDGQTEEKLTCRDAGITVLRLTVPKGAELPGHRDCLGTLMGLGLERRAVGDIVVKTDAVYLFVKDSVAPYLINSLSRVGKSPVNAEVTELPEDFSADRAYERVTLTLASLRADAITAALTGVSREEAKTMVHQGLFTRNYLLLGDPECRLAEGDVFSLRGKGRYRLAEIAGQTKKGRLKIVLQKYV
jgi:RNA-binding protein YlmH